VYKVKDRLLLGALAGIICGIPGRLVNDFEYDRGLTDVKYGQMAANLFLPKNKLNTKEARIVGSLTNHTSISLMGITLCYLLSATGRDNAALKGAGIGAAAWTAVYGVTARFGLSVKTRKPLAPILSFVDHTLFGVMCGLFISKLGHDSLFPDMKITNSKDKLPLVPIGQRNANESLSPQQQS